MNAELNDYVHSNFPAIARMAIKRSENGDRIAPISEPEFRADYGQDAFYPTIGIWSSFFLLFNFRELIEPKFYSRMLKAFKKIDETAKRLQSEKLDKS